MSIPTLYLDLTMTRHEEHRTRSYPKPKVPDRYMLQTLVITVPIPDSTLEKLRLHFPNIHYFPDGNLSKDKDGKVLREGEVWFTGIGAFPGVVEKIEDVPKARVLQLMSGESFYLFKYLSYIPPCEIDQITTERRDQDR
jgi:hypothetical protein